MQSSLPRPAAAFSVSANAAWLYFLPVTWYSSQALHQGEPLNIMDKKANHFSGQLGFVLAAARSAVGVGNLWRFPYLAAMGRAGVVVGALCSLPRISSR